MPSVRIVNLQADRCQLFSDLSLANLVDGGVGLETGDIESLNIGRKGMLDIEVVENSVAVVQIDGLVTCWSGGEG